jgi:hypothetical protein
MLKNKLSISQGNINFDKQRIYDSLTDFLEGNLSGFPSYLKSVDETLTKENDVTQQLFIFLDDKIRSDAKNFIPFKLINQFAYAKSFYSSDIGVIVQHFSRRDPFFVIEAKRLPIKEKKREREYVEGKYGGIERFKREIHGQGLPTSAIIGYVQEENPNFWFKKISEWITDLIKGNSDNTIVWNKKDNLIFDKNIKGIHQYTSYNIRSSGTEIKLIHYWIDLQ